MNVLMSGCSSGIGRAAAEAFVAGGHRVFAGVRRPEAFDEIGGAEVVQLDVTDSASVREAVATTIAAAGSIDALVNNAGIAAFTTLEETDEELFRRILDTNLLGVHRLTNAVLPHMRSQGRGRIVNVSSLNGRVAVPWGGPYSASKYALEGWSESLAYELHGSGITVTIVEPGVFKTAIDDNLLAVGDSDGSRAMARNRIAMADKAPPLSLAADAIVAAATDAEVPLRIPVGPDAVWLLDARSRMDDAEFAELMRGFFGLS
jgi:NAD(P)-dependent dehydrogenase (short-subunit alcohol dehydrogenase family)